MFSGSRVALTLQAAAVRAWQSKALAAPEVNAGFGCEVSAESHFFITELAKLDRSADAAALTFSYL